MSIAVQCSNCEKGYQVRSDLAGKRFKCKCGEVVAVAKPTVGNSLLDEELNPSVNPVEASSANEWAEASGNTDLADTINNKMSTGLRHNEVFMMSVVGVIAAVIFIVSVSAIIMGTP
jgi:hypothetical protein